MPRFAANLSMMFTECRSLDDSRPRHAPDSRPSIPVPVPASLPMILRGGSLTMGCRMCSSTCRQETGPQANAAAHRSPGVNRNFFPLGCRARARVCGPDRHAAACTRWLDPARRRRSRTPSRRLYNEPARGGAISRPSGPHAAHRAHRSSRHPGLFPQHAGRSTRYPRRGRSAQPRSRWTSITRRSLKAISPRPSQNISATSATCRLPACPRETNQIAAR